MLLKNIKSAVSEALGSKSQCCFCGELIKGETPVVMNLDLGGGETQSMSAHGSCLQEKLHSSVPFIAPDEINNA
jgi:hypothetical protein